MANVLYLAVDHIFSDISRFFSFINAIQSKHFKSNRFYAKDKPLYKHLESFVKYLNFNIFTPHIGFYTEQQMPLSYFTIKRYTTALGYKKVYTVYAFF